MRLLAAFIIVTMVIVYAINSANAMGRCGPRDYVVKSLASDYKELHKGFGLSKDGTLMEIWVSKGGSFTLLKTSPISKISCVIAGGENWHFNKSTKPKLTYF